MQKHRASQAGHGWIVVVSDHHDKVVEVVVAAQNLMPRRMRQLDRTVVVRGRRIVAPTVVGKNGTRRQTALGPRHPIGTPEDFARGKDTDGRGAVALPLLAANAGATERD